MTTTLYIFAPLSAMRKRTRLAKMARYLEDQEIPVVFFGWERLKGEATRFRWDGRFIDERILLKGGGYASRLARLLYPAWMVVVFVRVLLLPRASKCWCLGWETAFPARIAALYSRCDIAFDDADRFSMLIKLPGPLHRILTELERWTSRECLLHIVPGWTRYDWRHDRMVLLRNTPMTADYEAAMQISRISVNKEFLVYVNGWIAWDTGARTLLRSLDELARRGKRCGVVVAGRVASEEGRQLIEHPWAEFRGELPQVEALKLYRQTDVALTLYDPSVAINQQAESNKWGDCVFLGTPFIVNSEVQTARKFVEAGAAFDFAYDDHVALADLIERLAQESGLLETARRSLQRFEAEYSPFEGQIRPLFAAILARQQ